MASGLAAGAAENANTAAQGAERAASGAREAGNEAITAAQSASSAAGVANAAGQRANASADAANAAAKRAEDSVLDLDNLETEVGEIKEDYVKKNDIPNVYDWAKAEVKPSYTASEVGAAPAVHKHVKADITDFPTLSTVATSGSYNDLTNKPTIPTLPTLATVATSGSYNDLKNKPTIPTNTN